MTSSKWLYVVIFIPIGFYFYFLVKHMVNAPINDDYTAVLDFLISYQKESSSYEKFKLLFSQHNEHRLFYNRVITLVSFYIFGQVNFNFLIVVGNLSLGGIFFLLYKNCNEKFNDIKYFVPVSFILFNNYFNNLI